jgi:hypothetical protein
MEHELSSAAKAFKPGLYRHYKGKDYCAMGVVRHSEDLGELVLYQPQYGGHGLRLRHLSNFTEEIDRGGKVQPRFALTHEEPGSRVVSNVAELSREAATVRRGTYLHFKGAVYCVHGVAKWGDMDDPLRKDEEFVIYQHTDGDKSWWARPLASFLSSVDVGGTEVRRFKFEGRAC